MRTFMPSELEFGASIIFTPIGMHSVPYVTRIALWS